MLPIRINTPHHFLITLFIVGIVTGIQYFIWPFVGSAPFILYYPTISLAALYGDGLFGIALTTVLAQVLFNRLDAIHSAGWTASYARLAIFVASAFFIRQITMMLSASLRRVSESEARHRHLFENALDAIIAIDEQSTIVEWNSPATQIFGYRKEEAIGKKMPDLIIPPEMREKHLEGMTRYLKTGKGAMIGHRVEIEAYRSSGERFWVELSITSVRVRNNRVFYGAIRDISERNRLMKDLEEAIRARDEFISIASHELKTPVTTLKMQFELAARQLASGDTTPVSPQRKLSQAQITNQQIDRMARLIDDMLDVSRLKTGKLKMDIKTVDLSQLVSQTLDKFEEQFTTVGTVLVRKIRPSVKIDCDATRIEQVLSNLLTNALKYGKGKSVTVSLESDIQVATIKVRDEGPGIAPENLERIFHRFERAADEKQISGLGLGLYISRQIVDAHHGKIWAESELGKGTCVIIELPVLHF